MKKFSINLLKVSLLSILGLCMIGMATEVNAARKLLRTYYAYPGQEITIQSNYDGDLKCLYNGDFTAKGKTEIDKETYRVEDNKCTFTVPVNGIEIGSSYYIYTHVNLYTDFSDIAEIYIMPKLELTDSQGNKSVTINVGDTEQIKYKNNHEYWKAKGATNSKTDTRIHNLSDLKATDVKTQTAEKRYIKLTEVSFISSDKSVATVDANGLITAKKAGTATITMTRKITQQRVVDNKTHTATSTFTESIQVNVTDNGDKEETSGGKVTLTINYNGGTSVDGKETEKAFYTKGTEITLTNKYVAAREGYKIKGWGTDNKAAKFSEGDKVTLTENITLYAIWEKEGAATPPAKPQDANGTEFEVGNYVKYTDNTNEGGWNLRETARGKKLGEIKTGTMLEVTEVSTTDICIKVKVLDGDLEGKEGWLTISAKENFEILADYTPEEGEGEGQGEGEGKGEGLGIDLGNFRGILDIIWKFVKILIENLPGMIEKASPYIQSGVEIVGGLLSGLMQ